MVMVKQSSSRYEQKRMSMLESGIRAAKQSGIYAEQINQLVGRVYGERKQDTEEGSITRRDADNHNREVLDQEQQADKAHKHVVLPLDTYKQFEGRRSQRFSRPVAKLFQDHPELLERYNVLRDHRFSRFTAIDIVMKAHYEKGNNIGGHEELHPKEIYPLDLTSHGWKKFMEEHKLSFAKMHDMRMHEGLSHLQATNSIFKEMDHAYRATNGKSIFDLIDEMPEHMDSAGKGKNTADFKAKERNPELKPRYFKHFKQNR